MRRLTLILFAAVVIHAGVYAGTESNSVTHDGKAVQPSPCDPDALTEVIYSTDYGFHQNLDRGSANMETEHNNLELDRRIPLNFLSWPNVQCGQWFLRLGADYERYDFSIHNERRLPDTLQSAAGVVALEYLYNNQAAFMIETRPGVYFEHKINAGAFDSPVTLTLAFPLYGDKVYGVAGAYISALVSPPVFPIGGIDWVISDKWDLRAVYPEPRLVYHYNKDVDFFAGGEIDGGGYKTDHREVSPSKLSGAVVTFGEERAGVGVTWKAEPFTVELAGGYTIESQFYFNRAIQTFSAHPAPYVSLAARLDF